MGTEPSATSGLKFDSITGAVERAMATVGLTQETLGLLTLFPLLYVAWADGELAEAETRKIMEVAEESGMSTGARGKVLLDWLDRRPDERFWAAGLYLVTVVLGPEAALERKPLLELCEQVGRAAGGLFGTMFALSDAEREALHRVAAALELGDAVTGPRGDRGTTSTAGLLARWK